MGYMFPLLLWKVHCIHTWHSGQTKCSFADRFGTLRLGPDEKRASNKGGKKKGWQTDASQAPGCFSLTVRYLGNFVRALVYQTPLIR